MGSGVTAHRLVYVFRPEEAGKNWCLGAAISVFSQCPANLLTAGCERVFTSLFRYLSAPRHLSIKRENLATE